MVNACQPLWHAVVVGVLGFESELKIAVPDASRQSSVVSRQSAIGGNSAKGRVAIFDQPQGNIAVRQCSLRRPIDCADEIIVEIGRAQRNLCLLERKKTVMVPRRLAE